MEDVIYEQIIARISANAAYFTGQVPAQPVPETLAWFEDQYNRAQVKDDVVTYPFDCPAVFIQFEPTKYTSNNGISMQGDGVVILHLVQSKYVDGREGAANHATFKTMLDFMPLFINLLDGYKLPCSARLQLASTERDHLNWNFMVDKVSFNWSAKRTKPAGIPA